MINKIIASTLFISCLFAISLSLFGVEGPIEIGPQFRVFLTTCSIELEKFKISIPNIPSIPLFEAGEDWTLVLNFLIRVVNGLSTLINFIITILNVAISVLQFLFIILKNLIAMRDFFIQA